ncbi:MAG: HesA/MoeB/ThiF family protein [Eubacterium sp.]
MNRWSATTPYHLQECERPEKLLNGKVLIIGAGGLVLRQRCICHSRCRNIVDADEVDLSNLQRQIIHGTADVGKAKVKPQRDYECDEPDVTVYYRELYIGDIMDLIKDYDFIIDGTDNFLRKSDQRCVLWRKTIFPRRNHSL